jgi:hypothetical protein
LTSLDEQDVPLVTEIGTDVKSHHCSGDVRYWQGRSGGRSAIHGASRRARAQLGGLGVALDLLIEARGVELLEPGAEFRKLAGRQLGDGFFEVFDGQGFNIAEKML